MIGMTLSRLAAVLDLPLPPGPDVTITGVEFDSRRVRPGDLFVALPGEHVDGHDFAEAAAAAGAVAALGSRPVTALPTLVVAPAGGRDRTGAVLAALSTLAHHVAAELIADGLTVIGITGSAGKTSTKDLTAAVLRTAGTVIAPPESFNNELGHPYTVLRTDSATDYLVLELSARGIGHIASLARIAPPRIGAVLNVGTAHLGEFGSREAIATAKGELVEALPAADRGGVAVLNADDPLVAAMAHRTAAAVVTVGTGAGADIRAEQVILDDRARGRFTLTTPEGDAPVRLRVSGQHQVANALAAAAIGRAAGMEVGAVADALSTAAAVSRWRMEVSELVDGTTVINDAYNANPESTTAALRALAHIGAGRRRWAVLGEMAELGADAPAAHERVGHVAAGVADEILVVGEAARTIVMGAEATRGDARHIRWVPDIDTAAAVMADELRPGDTVLVKASRAVGLERLAARIMADTGRGQEQP